MTALASLASLAFGVTLAGGALPILRRGLSRQSLWRFLSLGSGVLLSVTFMEILPEALSEAPPLAGRGLVFSFLLLFALEHFAMMHSCQEVLEDCNVHAVGWAALAAMGLHSLLDGINLAVAFKAGPVAGAAVGGAIILHKFTDGLTLTTLFRQAGYSDRRSLLALVSLALATPLGAAAAWYWLVPAVGTLSFLLGFSGGCFIYIATADILPRLHREKDPACLFLFAAGLLSGALLPGEL